MENNSNQQETANTHAKNDTRGTRRSDRVQIFRSKNHKTDLFSKDRKFEDLVVGLRINEQDGFDLNYLYEFEYLQEPGCFRITQKSTRGELQAKESPKTNIERYIPLGMTKETAWYDERKVSNQIKMKTKKISFLKF